VTNGSHFITICHFVKQECHIQAKTSATLNTEEQVANTCFTEIRKITMGITINKRMKRFSMKRDHFSFTVLALFAWGLIFCPGSISSANDAHPPDPTEQFRPYVEEIISILSDSELQGEEKCTQRREKVMEIVSECFDFQEMSKRVLGKTWRELSKKDQKYFVSLFSKLLEHAYIGKIEEYTDQKIVFRNQLIKGKRAQVNTDIVGSDTLIAVSYIMILKDDMWMVYDIIIEGVSLVRNYMEQFKGILRKEGYASLLKQVEDKVAELDQGIGKKTT
jgi:phospholipid transport system substrate-binding protein